MAAHCDVVRDKVGLLNKKTSKTSIETDKTYVTYEVVDNVKGKGGKISSDIDSFSFKRAMKIVGLLY